MMQRFPMVKLAAVPLLTASALLSGGAALADGATNDTLACYRWDQFPNERLNLGVRGGGPLSSPQDVNIYDHPTQRTHGVHAKHVGVCGRGTNGAVEGVVVVAAATGAHMGLHTMVSRGGEDSGDAERCGPVFIDCFSEEASTTPEQWTCQSRNELGAYHGESTLSLVALDTAPNDPRCAVFEDDDAFEDSNERRGVTRASGTLLPRDNRRGRDDDD